MNQHGSEQFKPNTTVAAIVHCKGKFLLVEEKENDRTVYNQPAGHLEAKENLIAAMQRELEEETGLLLSPDYLSGIYYFHRPELALYFMRFSFVFELAEQIKCAPLDAEITACHWLSLDEITRLKPQLRSTMVLDCINDYLTGQKISLSTLKSNL
ncbi:NUDIX hydrolase [Thalassotalea sp. M1531]|uniref:NUDIX hydrolase n=1 Tax=Thalassotalea algicola TaxID=2716224 RepID=A0A7Y0Q7H4_9GAMM|nr:NUDIX hydrolase [Thalassotalea algicola]NMP32403.1 NUDIX hydrolase [Thalassotalea algicola]